MEDGRQKALMDSAIKLASPIKYTMNITNTVLFAVILYVMDRIFEFGIDIYTILIFFGLLLIYMFARDLMMNFQAKKKVFSQYQFLLKNKPGMELYMPVLGQSGLSLFVRKAGLYLLNGEVFLEIFPSQKVKETETRNKTAVAGREFVIHRIEKDQKQQYYHVKSSVSGMYYDLLIPLDEEFVSLLQTLIQIPEPEKEVS